MPGRLRTLLHATLLTVWAPPIACAAADDASLERTPAPRPATADIAPRIDALIDALSPAACGAAVFDLRTGERLYARDVNTPMIPASNQKLFVMAAAIEQLGARFAFRTRVARRGRDLIIIGDGDPAIGDARLAGDADADRVAVFRQWAKALAGRGVTHIAGDLVMDESIFDDQYVHPTWEDNDLLKWYAAPVGALNLNDNCIELTVWPGEKIGAPARWSVTPTLSLLDVINRVDTAAKGVPVINRPSRSFTFEISGPCGKRAKLAPITVPDPGLMFANACRLAMSDAGVDIAGGIRRQRVRNADGTLPDDCTLLAEHRTPLTDVLRRVGKNSQNLFAECLAKRLGYQYMASAGSPAPVGRWVAAAVAVDAYLSTADIDTTAFVFADGSGLSRENRATADQLTAVLLRMHRHRDADLLIENLAVAGVDGSLRRRMRDIAGRVVGKTGTMRGVKTLSGYVLDSQGAPAFAFSILFNDIRGSSAPFKRVQDRICQLLVARADGALP